MKENTILIIEDNAELRDFIRNCLDEEYGILEAENGRIGWEIAITEIPNIIITDVMMPEMDGNEFCKNVKLDERTSHIPVIMLSAKAAVEQQVEGIESGADVYLTKPFSIEVLQSYLKNLLKSKEVLRQHFSQKIFLEPAAVEIGTVDKKFIEKLMEIIEADISTPHFNVADIAKNIGMSKPVLYKKFHALAKMPIGEFVKSIKLKKAAQLLLHDKLNITEVAWEVGFSDRKYFSKEFKKFFGKSPSEYMGKTDDEHDL